MLESPIRYARIGEDVRNDMDELNTIYDLLAKYPEVEMVKIKVQ